MQVVIRKTAWLMQITMKTSAVESLSAAGNIFVGQRVSPKKKKRKEKKKKQSILDKEDVF